MRFLWLPWIMCAASSHPCEKYLKTRDVELIWIICAKIAPKSQHLVCTESCLALFVLQHRVAKKHCALEVGQRYKPGNPMIGALFDR